MGFFEQVQEAARLIRVGDLDNWYFKEQPYILEIRASGLAVLALAQPSAFFALPLGPQEYNVKRVFRQSVTPTMGGTTAEEAGLLWREITVRGSFGLTPKGGQDTTALPDRPLAGEKLSGPGWTRRMLRNIFEKYAEMKANPLLAPLTTLVWHDMRSDEHYVVVPEEVDIPRTVDKRSQHPYNFQLKAIAKASSLLTPLSVSSLKGLGKVKQALAALNKGVQMINAAIQEGSAILGEVRYFAAQIDSVLTGLTNIVNSVQDFLDGVTDTLSIGRTFITSTATLLEEVLDTLETATDLPDAVRHNYAMALDGLHTVGAQVSAFGRTYDSAFTAIESSEGGAGSDSSATLAATASAGAASSASDVATRRERVSDQALLDAGALSSPRLRGSYSGFREYAISAGDTLASLAARFLSDGTYWYDLAIVNGLKPPYVSETGAPGTVTVGDVIVVPLRTTERGSSIVSGEGSLTGRDLLGIDIKVFEDSNSIPGRPVIDIQIDKRTHRDVALVSGIPNFAQALQMRMWTERGHLPLVPGYGLPRQIGVKQVDSFLTLLRLAAQQTVRQDSRVASLGAIRFEVADDLVEISLDVVPIGYENAQNVTLSVV